MARLGVAEREQLPLLLRDLLLRLPGVARQHLRLDLRGANELAKLVKLATFPERRRVASGVAGAGSPRCVAFLILRGGKRSRFFFARIGVIRKKK